MSDYKGNFYSSDAYNPEYNAFQVTAMKSHTVTAEEVTATKVLIDSQYNKSEETPIVLAVVYRSSVALPTNFTLIFSDYVGDTSLGEVYLSGNANYTLTAGDVIVYINSRVRNA